MSLSFSLDGFDLPATAAAGRTPEPPWDPEREQEGVEAPAFSARLQQPRGRSTHLSCVLQSHPTSPPSLALPYIALSIPFGSPHFSLEWVSI